MIVRRIGMDYDLMGRGAYAEIPPEIRGKFYGGIDRLPWFDIDDLYYENKLDPSMSALLEKIHRAVPLEIWNNIEQVKRLLTICDTDQTMNEIIAVDSRQLEAIYGRHDAEEIDWSGFDPVVIGEFSLLREGIFRHPETFGRWIDRVNKCGLLDSEEAAYEYISAYSAAEAHNLVEPYSASTLGTAVIKIGLPKVK